MLTVRAYSLVAAAFLLVACGDDDDKSQFSGQPGLATGPCVQSLCYSELVCIQGGCYPNPGSGGSGNSGNSNASNATTADPTDSGASESGTTGNVSTDPTVTSGDPPGTTTDVDPTNATNPTTITTTSTTTITTDPSESDSNDSQSFVQPPDTDGERCGGSVCSSDEVCSQLDDTPVCLSKCDPLNKNSCLPGDVCVPDQDSNFLCAPDVSEAMGKIGDPCMYGNACDPGNICLNGTYVANCASDGCCSTYCDLDLADPCPQYGMVCVPWYEQGQAPSGEEDIGVCLLE